MMMDDDGDGQAASMLGDTPLSAVLTDLDDEGRNGQFQAVEGGAIRCLTCHREFSAATEQADDVTRLEGASDPADMSIVVPLTCPLCGAAGALIARYGPEADIADADVLVALDRQPHEGSLGQEGPKTRERSGDLNASQPSSS